MDHVGGGAHLLPDRFPESLSGNGFLVLDVFDVQSGSPPDPRGPAASRMAGAVGGGTGGCGGGPGEEGVLRAAGSWWLVANAVATNYRLQATSCFWVL